MTCPEIRHPAPMPVDLRRFQVLHDEGRGLIQSWFERSLALPETSIFEAFIFAWFAVNGWAACITGTDRDDQLVSSLADASELQTRFDQLIASDPQFRSSVDKFRTMLPVFKAQIIRREGMSANPPGTRAQVIAYYMAHGRIPHRPPCATRHHGTGGSIPADWPHCISGIYQIRCNLFHGEKSVHSEMDKRLVSRAFHVLTGFLRGASLL
jgi:hypothetical protein